jgi:hypothetical protein
MLRLKSERDKLAKGLFDSQPNYMELLAENERLKSMVQEAEVRAKTDKNKAFTTTYKILLSARADIPANET